MPKSRSCVGLAIAGLATVGVLAGCTADGPSDLDTPEVMWPDGAPDSEFEDDPAVIALREAHVQEAIAWNALDYSDPDLVYRWGFPMKPFIYVEATAQAASERIADGRSDPLEWTMLGPVPLSVYEVREDDAFTTVVTCLGSDFVRHDPVTGELAEYHGQLEQFEVTFFSDGSSSIANVATDQEFSDQYFLKCKEDSPARGVFDPEPEPFSGDEDDLKRPAPAEEYGFDNIS